MTITRNKAIINLTEEECKAIKTVKKLANDIFYGLDDDETARFNGIMKESWGNNTDDIEVGINDLSCLLDDFEDNINVFNAGIDLN